MRHTPRPYQLEGIDRIREAQCGGHNRVCACAPTGSGKTILACAMIEQEVREGRPCMFLSHRKELTDQTSRALTEANVRHGVLMADHYLRRPEELVQVASIQTLTAMRLCDSCKNKPDLKATCTLCHGIGKLRSRKLPPAEFIVVDEAHRVLGESYQKLLENYPNAKILAITATPWRLDGRGLKRMFSKLIVFAEMRRLIDDGFLLPMRVFGPKEPLNLRSVGKSRGDYKNDELADEMRKAKLVGKIVENWQKLAENRRTVVFATNVAHSHDIVRRFCEAGVRAEHLDGETPKPLREQILSRLASGQTRVVSNVDVLCEGWDLPSLGCVVLARPTLSITRYLQQVGRSSRKFEGQIYAIILDHADCARRHGLPDDPREWSLEDRKNESVPVPLDLIQCDKCGGFYNSKLDDWGRPKKCPHCTPKQLSIGMTDLPEEVDDDLVEHTMSPVILPSGPVEIVFPRHTKPTHGKVLCGRCCKTWVTVMTHKRVRVTCRQCLTESAQGRKQT